MNNQKTKKEVNLANIIINDARNPLDVIKYVFLSVDSNDGGVKSITKWDFSLDFLDSWMDHNL